MVGERSAIDFNVILSAAFLAKLKECQLSPPIWPSGRETIQYIFYFPAIWFRDSMCKYVENTMISGNRPPMAM
ncbi:hypothetical protein L905_07070 [Agrobacterium sp. TS43]|nr:hypothetical protein L902_01915 [Agrobacterium radiobacter DSM 30147]KDR88539.1 hypothetical protein K538_15680 [Agrobacterium tumefaciens GW4]KVK49910.1 hypothetical protein L903_18730 [Agrobacterium sp. JL28]KVK50201.1 hypothetical protein L904_18725 [Agrobacterium sp. LY4]KVK54262.1 hypothetical protein L901_17995 [Agrobacterium sp. D14]KVK59243.1 hypothetical protein L905_07070 [Agrobacterium sp. TS43]KVK62957.1 hypothetical protein L906_17855 [Agrobacterium sp. TS45]KVK67480.1 hypoth